MPDEISLENVLRQCGDLGRYQLVHYIFLNLITIGSGILGFYYVFGVAEPSFRCRLPSNIWDNDRFEPINITHQELIDKWLSSTSKCNGVNGSVCTDFVYDRSIFGRTFTEDANFVCRHTVKRTWLSTVSALGATFFVLIIGSIGDKFGRKKMIQLSIIGLVGVTVITQLVLQFVSMTVDVKFILLLINQLVSSLDAYSMAFLLLMELTSSSHTSLAGHLALVAYPLGEVLVSVFAYIARDWLRLKWLITGFYLIILFYLYFVPESPYWLFSKKKYDQLEVCLRKIATINGRKNTQWFPKYTQLIQDPRIALRSTKHIKRTNKEKILNFLPRLSASCFIGFVGTFLYVKISYGLGAMNDTVSPYWNIIIGAAVEAIGCITASILITTRLGRKSTLIIYSLSVSICVLMIPFIMKPYPIVTVIISQIGKLAISGALGISWVYVPELFPMSMRGLANGIFAFVSRIGSILAPIIDVTLSDKYMKITFYVYSALTLVMIGIICLLPETRNRSFNDGEEDSDQIQTDTSHADEFTMS